MANTEYDLPRDAAAHASDAHGLSPDRCGAHELKGLLHNIADKILESDRRSGQVLGQMQERLNALGLEARSARHRVPAEFVPAFERVEESVAALADRIAQSAAGGRFGHPTSDTQAFREPGLAIPEHVKIHATAQTEPPAALRSGASQAKPESHSDAAVDPFEMVDRTVPETEHAWDREQAEALARVYESPEASFDRSREAAETGQRPVGRDWLEARFAEIAKRVEQSLREMRPENSLQAIDRRLDQLEERFSTALEGVATRSDVEGLRLVEAHINELAAQFESAHAQLGRLDSIENQLQAVVERLTDDRFNDLIESGARATDIEHVVADAAERGVQRAFVDKNATDISRIATEVAEAAISRYAEIATQPGEPAAESGHGVDQLRELIENFVAERRQGDEHTASMLDTMQQAMIRVLDRIDAMELAQTPAPTAPQEYVREQVRFGAPGSDAAGGARPVLDDARNAAQAATAAMAQVPQQVSPFAHVPSADVPSSPVRMLASDPRAVAPAPEPPRAQKAGPMQGRATPEQTKDDFVAAARRARRQVAGMPTDPVATPKSAESAKAAPAAGKAAATGNDKPVAKEKSALSFFGIQRKSFLGGAVAVLAIMVASLVMQPKNVEMAIRAMSPAPGPAATTVVEAAETAPGDLSMSDVAGATGAPGLAPTVGKISAPIGIMLQEGAEKPTPEQLDRLEQQQAMAEWSTRLGAAAAPTATPISLAPPQDISGRAKVEPATDGARAPTDLPPATVGPMSLRLAAANGDPSAQFEVAARLAAGKGTPQNFVEAIKWYQRSAQQGFAQAQYRLATLYERGLGVKADLGRARVWYKRAAEQGNVKAMHNLAVLSAGRQAGAPDYATAATWFAEAAEYGLTDSQFNLAVLYESGLGVQKDLKQAYKWFAIAARSGEQQTISRREHIRSQLSASEMEAAESMLRDWSPKPQDPMSNNALAAGEAWKRPAVVAPQAAEPDSGNL